MCVAADVLSEFLESVDHEAVVADRAGDTRVGKAVLTASHTAKLHSLQTAVGKEAGRVFLERQLHEELVDVGLGLAACVAYAVAVPANRVGCNMTRTVRIAGILWGLEEGLGLCRGVETERW